MVADRREQVFVSSTYVDLVEERQEVIQVLLAANCIPAGMELFPASNDDRWKLIQRVIDGCDYYLLIVGGRYGSVDPDTELSFTQMEYEYAKSRGIPVFAFLNGNVGKLERDKTELIPELWQRLLDFRNTVEASHIVKYWKKASDLPGQVALALIDARQNYPAVGWIRADEALTPETRAEISELKIRVKELESALEDALNTVTSAPEDIAALNESHTFGFSVIYHTPEQRLGDMGYYGETQNASVSVARRWGEVFAAIGPALLNEASESELRDSLASALWQVASQNGTLPDDIGSVQSRSVSNQSAGDLIVQLMAAGLIEVGAKKRNATDKNKYWGLTPAGRQELVRLRVVRTSEG